LRAEAAVLAKISHPNVVRIWDLEQIGRLTVLVQEYVDGGSLGRKLLTGERIAPATVFQIACDILAALRVTHQAGYIHGDVKPANILGPSTGIYKLADFGTAQRSDGPATPGGIVRGTWPYSAPESMEGFASPASDVYSLGLTLYHALTGQPAIQVTGFDECRAAHANLSLDPVHWTIPGVGQAASDLVTRMTRHDPAGRPSVSRLLREFRELRVPAAAPLRMEIAR
jgi:serine/threonine-protein kinase